ncbi:MAG: aryl-sulfate sulfotransferase [Candidatus Azotimanducaceae bacterium]
MFREGNTKTNHLAGNLLSKLLLLIVVLFLSGCSGEKNILPTASIFGPSEVVELNEVRLTSEAEDTDGYVLSYQWIQKSGPRIAAADVNSPSLVFIAPEVDSDSEVTWSLVVKDNDEGEISSGELSITVKQSLADSNTFFDYQVTEDDTEESVFISALTLDVASEVISAVSFKIEPKPNLISEAIQAKYSADLIVKENGIIRLPIFGLYSDYLNSVELTLFYKDGSISTVSKQIATAVYDNPMTLEVNTHVRRSLKPSYSYFYIKSSYGVHVIDIDGNFRWAANDQINAISSIYDRGTFKVFLDDELHELKLSGQTLITKVSQSGMSNIVAHHDVEIGKVGYLVEVDADKVNRSSRIIESVLLEIDSEGNALKEWDFGIIFRDYIESEGYDSGNFVRDGADWFHMNSAIYDPSDDSIIASSRENFVVKVGYESGELIWLLGDETKHWYVNYPPLQSLSLTSLDLKPIGQHSLSLIEGDLALFNNGQLSFQTPEGVPKGVVLDTSPSSIYRINKDAKEAEVVWNYDPLIYSDVCSSLHRDSTSGDGDYLITYSVVDRLDKSDPKKPVRTLIRGINHDMETLFEFQLPTINCRTSWQSRPLSEFTDLIEDN